MKFQTPRFLTEFYEARNVLSQLVAQQLTLRYRRTVLGYLWTLVNPLLMMSVMALVFSALFKQDLKTFAVFLFAAMIPWNFFSSVVTQSSSAFINNEGLIKKIYLPKIIFPASIAISLFLDSIFSFIILLFIILVLGGSFSFALFFLPISFFLVLIFSFGAGLIASVATVFFRDLQYILVIGMQGLFFLTPILYKPESLIGKVSWLVEVNPLTPFISLFRAPLIDGAMPSALVIGQSIAISTIALAIGLLSFVKNEKTIVFRL